MNIQNDNKNNNTVNTLKKNLHKIKIKYKILRNIPIKRQQYVNIRYTRVGINHNKLATR